MSENLGQLAQLNPYDFSNYLEGFGSVVSAASPPSSFIDAGATDNRSINNIGVPASHLGEILQIANSGSVVNGGSPINVASPLDTLQGSRNRGDLVGDTLNTKAMAEANFLPLIVAGGAALAAFLVFTKN